jgi:CDGSH-type Zn-finger protein
MVTIKVRQNGPYLVDGEDVTLVDWNGAPYQVPKRPFALCRCGGSMTKPFCDGTHSKAGFKAAEAAVPGSQDKLPPRCCRRWVRNCAALFPLADFGRLVFPRADISS